MEQLRCELLLELPDGDAERRLCHLQAARGSTEVQLLGHGYRSTQMAGSGTAQDPSRPAICDPSQRRMMFRGSGYPTYARRTPARTDNEFGISRFSACSADQSVTGAIREPVRRRWSSLSLRSSDAG